MDFHGNQDLEWEVFSLAKKLDKKAALKSISMGMPQIMGFNHKKIGYKSVNKMYNDFCRDIRYHILSLFEFLDEKMIQALQQKDFELFARYYNGAGQAATYGEWIRENHEEFKEVYAAIEAKSINNSYGMAS